MTKQHVIAAAVAFAGLSACVIPAQAQEFYPLSRVLEDMKVSTAIRIDAAARTTSAQNFNNQGTNYFNDVSVDRQAFVPPGVAGLPQTDGNDWNIPAPGFNDSFRRGDQVPIDSPDMNLLQTRIESEIELNFSRSLRFVARIRGVYDPGIYDDFDARSVDGAQGSGIVGGDPNLYAGEPNYMEAIAPNGRNINPLEFSGQNYNIDFPALLFEYRTRGLTLRLGNQQIAWGQSIAFQTFDIPNGLDFRRHSILDRAQEEFSDKRVPTLSLRGTYQLGRMVIDGFVGKFQPTILSNPNTPYNVIPTQFTVREDYFRGGFDDKINGGIRLKADYNDWGWQAMAASRYNPLGAFSWTRSGVTTEVAGNAFGVTAATAYQAKNPGCEGSQNPRNGPGPQALCRNSGSLGEALAKTPIVSEPGGVTSGREWFTYAAEAKLNGLEGYNVLLNEFPDLFDVYLREVESMEELRNQLDTVMYATNGGYRGYINREYFREEVFGLGGKFVTNSDIDLLNAIILNVEMQYTPERVFTATTLSNEHLKRDEFIASFVAEKWTRWSAKYPAAYLVFQYQFRSESDLVGLNLDGYGGDENTIPEGIPNANYFVLAGFQPTPGRTFVFEFTSLFDARGGLLVQPLLKWNIGSGFKADFFYNYVDAGVWGKRSESVFSNVDYADEVAVRLSYSF